MCPSAACGALSLQAITKAVNFLADGRVPEEVASHLCGATLLAVKKKNGGLRPIAVGEVLRRLTSKCLSRSVLSDAIDILAPLQVGVGVRPVCCSHSGEAGPTFFVSMGLVGRFF